MKRYIHFIFLIALIFLAACRNENNYIVAADISVFIPDSTQIANGITLEQQQKITDDFPKANQKISNPLNKNEIVLLILKEDNDYFERQFDNNIEDIKSKYSNIFFNDSIQSMQLNMFGLTRYYISKDHIVLDIGRGTSPSSTNEFLISELERNTFAN